MSAKWIDAMRVYQSYYTAYLEEMRERSKSKISQNNMSPLIMAKKGR